MTFLRNKGKKKFPKIKPFTSLSLSRQPNGDLPRVLASDLPEHSVGPVIRSTERLERLFEQKPHGFSNRSFQRTIFGLKLNNHACFGAEQTLTVLSLRVKKIHREVSHRRRRLFFFFSLIPASFGANYRGTILAPPASFSNLRFSSSPDPNFQQPFSGKPFNKRERRRRRKKKSEQAKEQKSESESEKLRL